MSNHEQLQTPPMYDVSDERVIFFPGAADAFEAPRVSGPPLKSWNHGFTGADENYVVQLYYRTNGQPVALVSIRQSSPLAKLDLIDAEEVQA